MDPQAQFCPNMACPARGQIGQGNIGTHSQKDGRYICRTCGKTFSESKETAYYRVKKVETFTIAVKLLAHGCPVQAIVAAFEVDERTVAVTYPSLAELRDNFGDLRAPEMEVFASDLGFRHTTGLFTRTGGEPYKSQPTFPL